MRPRFEIDLPAPVGFWLGFLTTAGTIWLGGYLGFVTARLWY